MENQTITAIDLTDWLPDPEDRARGAFALVLKNVLTPQECQQIIAKAHEEGFAVDKRTYRHCQHLTLTDTDWKSVMFERIKSFLPQQWDIRRLSRSHNTPDIRNLSRYTNMVMVGLESRVRCLQYNEGHFFQSHIDTYYCKENHDLPSYAWERGVLSFMVYLNDDFVGGTSRFNVQTCPSVRDNKICLGLTCAYGCCRDPPVGRGDVLVFQHDVMHQGSMVVSGTKYVCRGEVAYQMEWVRNFEKNYY